MTHRLPLRTQVLLLLLGSVALVTLATALAGTAALRSYLLDRVDDDLVSSLRAPGTALDLPDRDGPGPGGRGRGGPRSPLDFVTAVYLEDGTVSALNGIDLDDGAAPDLPAREDLPSGPFTVPSQAGFTDWRVVAAQSSTGQVFVSALPLSDVEDTVQRLLLINGAVGLVAVTAAGLLGWGGVRRSLRPLAQVEATAHAIAEGDLSVRVPASDPRTEVGSLSASFNTMVDRFESAYRAQQSSEAQARASEERMRRFVGDASHELRTPLTSIRGFAELYRQGAVSGPDALARVMARIEDEASRMGLLVEDLLLLARLDQQRPLDRVPVDLLAVAADVVHDAQAVRPGHVVRLTAQADGEPLLVLGDDGRLRQVLTNLVTNAATHTPEGTHVDVSLRRQGGAVLVDVSDDGPGMSREVAARVFERFYRADSSRHRGTTPTSGSGLGLSIVAALVAAHGGSVHVDSRPGEGTVFTVRLPALVP